MLTDKQLEQRKTLVTATDIPTLLGLNPWSSPLQIYERKKGISQPYIAGDAAMWGHIKEPWVVQMYKDHHEKNIKTHSSKTVELKKALTDEMGIGATPDRICVRDHHAWLLECKTTGSGFDWNTSAPDRVRYQVQWQMFVMHQKLLKKKTMNSYWKYFPRDLEDWFCDIACEHGNGMKVYREYYDRHMVADAIEAAKDFAGKMKSNTPPNPTAKDAEHLTNKERSGEGLLDGVSEHAEIFLRAKAAAKQNKAICDEYKAFLLAAMDEAGGINKATCQQYQISITQGKDREKKDWESIALSMGKQNPKLFKFLLEENTTQQPGNKVFRVKEMK